MAYQRQNRDDVRRRRTGPQVEPWQFEVVREAGLAVASELSIDKVLQKLVDLARDLVHAKFAALGVAREDRRGLSRFIVSGITEEEIREIPHWPVGLGLLGVLLKEPKPLRVKDISRDPRSVGFPPGHPGMTSFLGVPIISKGRILGNFYFTEKAGAPEFSESDESLIVLFAAHAAVAIENARLYTETNELLKEKIVQVERDEQRSRFLAELDSLLLVGAQQIEALPLEQIASRTTAIMGDACAIYVLDPSDPKTVLRKTIFHTGPARAAAAEDLVSKSWEPIAEIVIDKRRPIFILDISSKLLPYMPLDPGLMKEKRFSCAMILPLNTANRLHGVFASLGSIPLTFSDADLNFGMLVAERIAIAIENAFLFQELAAALQTRDEFISIATHELKTPITVLMGYAQAASKVKADPDFQRKALDSINQQSKRLVGLVNDLLDVSRIRAGRLEFRLETVNLVQLASEAVQRFEVQTRLNGKHRLVVDVAQSEVGGSWDAARLEQVLNNLVSNAIKYSPGGGEVRVAVRKIDDKALISVTDRGIGIPLEQQKSIFEPFFRAPNASRLRIEGTGLGLHITKEIVDRLGGRIWFESEEGKGTTFFVELPLAPPR